MPTFDGPGTMTSLASEISTVTEALTCRIAGSLIQIGGLPPAVRVRMADLLRPFVVSKTEATAGQSIRLEAVRRGRGDWIMRAAESSHSTGGDIDSGGRLGHLLATLEWRAVGDALAATSECAVVHGAALSRGECTLLLLGQSGAGKTTLTLGLMGRGWLPFTDDMALIDAKTLEVRVFPRCFHIEGGTLAALPVRPHIEQSISLPTYWRPVHWADGARRPTMIVLVERDPQRSTALRAATQAEGAGAILDATLRNQLSGSALAHISTRIAAQAHDVWTLNNMSLVEALDYIDVHSAR